jgi:hypothetical protein
VLHALASSHADRVATAFRGARPSARHLVLALAPTGRRLCIITDDERIDRYVRTVYANLAVRAAVGDDPLDYGRLFTSRVPATVCFNGIALPGGRDGNAQPPPWWSSGAYLIDQFVWRSLALDAGWISLYGCTFSFAGRTSFIAGPSGAGKTTLGLALAAAGATLCGDEMVLIERATRRAAGLRRALTIRTPALERLGDARIADIVNRHAHAVGDPTSGMVALDASHLGSPAGPLPLGAVILAERGEGGARLEPVSTARAAARLTPFLTHRTGDLGTVSDVADALAGAPAYRLTLGEPHETAALVLGALSPC